MAKARSSSHGGRAVSDAAATAAIADEDVLRQKLAAHGEAFLSMFDDYDEQQQQQRQAAAATVAAGQPHDRHSASDEDADSSSRESSDSDDDEQPMAGPGPLSIEHFLYSGRKGMQHGGRAAAVQQPQETDVARMQRLLLERRLRKQFMSAKASSIFEDVEPLPALPADNEDNGPSAEEFAQMQREVEMLGGAALDKKARKAWQAGMLAKLGAKADKAPRTAARIGRGMAQAAAKREAKALAEAIETGMVHSKGRGKKKRAELDRTRDRGLQEAGAGFKNGVLRVKMKGPKRGSRGSGAGGALRGFDKVGSGGGKPQAGSGKKKKKGGAGGKKGGKKGGKRR